MYQLTIYYVPVFYFAKGNYANYQETNILFPTLQLILIGLNEFKTFTMKLSWNQITYFDIYDLKKYE